MQIYSSCDEAHRLTQSGELNVPPEYADEYCEGPCLSETKHVLDCMGGILKGFVFYNRATLNNLRDTIESGCGSGPKKGVILNDLFISYQLIDGTFYLISLSLS